MVAQVALKTADTEIWRTRQYIVQPFRCGNTVWGMRQIYKKICVKRQRETQSWNSSSVQWHLHLKAAALNPDTTTRLRIT